MTGRVPHEERLPETRRAYMREYQREWMKARRADYFNGKSCEHCGSTRDLELDHVDPTRKVSHKVWSWSRKRREAELVKCQVLCSPCHKAKTLADRPVPPHATSGRYKRGCRCDTCKRWNRDRMRAQRARRRALKPHA